VTYSDFKGQVLEDVKMVELALANRVEFVSPSGGPQVTRLLRDGWVPVVLMRDYFDRGKTEALETIVGSSGWGVREDWLKENHDTVLRAVSVMFRIIDEKKANRLEAAKIQIPFLNSIAGTDFKPEDSQFLDEFIDPFYTFEEQESFWVNETDPLYYKNNIGAHIAFLLKQGTLKEDHDPDELIVADDIWKELDELRGKTERLFQEVDDLLENASGEKEAAARERLQQARKFYDARDYLDSFRFATAAKLWLK
jgi:hypothetical protein